MRDSWRFSVRLKPLPGEDGDDKYDPWKDGPYNDRVRAAEARYGQCKAVDLLDGYEPVDEAALPLAFTKDGSDYMATLYTRGEFGCALWENAESAPPA